MEKLSQEDSQKIDSLMSQLLKTIVADKDLLNFFSSINPTQLLNPIRETATKAIIPIVTSLYIANSVAEQRRIAKRVERSGFWMFVMTIAITILTAANVYIAYLVYCAMS